MSLAELTVDLLFKVFDGLDAESARCLGATSAWNRAVLTGWQDWRAKGGHGPSASYMGRPRLLRQKEKNESVILVSYPRSGNSLLRKLLERVTGVVTGSDTRPDRVLSRALLRNGLKGEGLVDQRSWVIKTHWPERYGCARFQAHRVILLIRNPFDAIDSYFNMGLTNTHEQSLREDLYESLAHIWDEMVRAEVKVWSKFNSYWLKKALPVVAIRYEDLILYPEEILTRLVAFLEKTTCEAVRASESGERIRTAARETFQARQTPYKPRSNGKVGASLRHYTQDQIDYFIREEGVALRAFGYDPVSQNFPKEILMLPPMERCVKNLDVVGAVVTVNRGRMVRELDDKYGRSITKVRHALTDEDRNPLPTVSRTNRQSPSEKEKIETEGMGNNHAVGQATEEEENVGKSP